MDNPGGFLPYSPPPSSVASSTASKLLPHPRASPLRAGGSKESSFIRYVDQRILEIQRKFAKRVAAPGTSAVQEDELGRRIDSDEPVRQLAQSEQWQDVLGYKSFAEAARDVEALIGVVWVSGTPSLQVPYLISLALLVNTMIPAFPASPRQLFRVLGKLDHTFASLLRGRDAETEETLPGFPYGRKVSVTEKVRLKSLVERTRIAVTRLIASGDFEAEDDPDSPGDEEEIEGDLIMDEADANDANRVPEDWDMEMANVYDKTLQEIGDSMDGPPIGIQTNSR